MVSDDGCRVDGCLEASDSDALVGVAALPRTTMLSPAERERVLAYRAALKIENNTRNSTLHPDEKVWPERHPLLESRGYILRPRYRPGWIPSWHGTDKWAMDCEDSFRMVSLQPIYADLT